METKVVRWETVALCFVLLSAATLMVSTPASAHHGTNIAFDHNKEVTIEGVVTEWIFKNPHVQVLVDVKDENGKIVNWSVEGRTVYQYSRAGWDRDSIKPGDRVTVVLHPSKFGTPAGVLVRMKLEKNGRELRWETGGQDE